MEAEALVVPVFEGKKEETDKKFMKDVESITKSTGTSVLSSPPEGLINKMLASKYRKSVVFEFGMGYGTRKVKKILSRGAKASVSVPLPATLP